MLRAVISFNYIALALLLEIPRAFFRAFRESFRTELSLALSINSYGRFGLFSLLASGVVSGKDPPCFSMSTTGRDGVADTSELRYRLPQEPAIPRQASDPQQTVADLNKDEKKSSKDDNNKRTYGRTPDGTGMMMHT